MSPSNSKCVLLVAAITCLLSLTALSINSFFFQYPGNLYLPRHTPFIALSLLLMRAGAILQFGPASRLATMLKEIMNYFLVLLILGLATTAAQFTPFSPIDKYIIRAESYFHFKLSDLMLWTHSHTYIKRIFEFAYLSLVYQIAFLPLLVIALSQYERVRQFYFFMITSALIGFTIYYFLPTTAPASMIDSPHFTVSQIATGLKFKEIHNYIVPSTLEGGMVAFPSFHVIWGWFVLYLIRGWPFLFGLLFIINLFLVASCVCLGWHYPLDILGSVLVIIAAHISYKICYKHAVELKKGTQKNHISGTKTIVL